MRRVAVPSGFQWEPEDVSLLDLQVGLVPRVFWMSLFVLAIDLW